MNNQSDEDIRNSIIGLGEKSIRKSYYPQLQKKINEIEELNKSLEKKVEIRTKELLEEKHVFETLFNETNDAFALIKNGKFIDCNSSALKLLKYEDKETFCNQRPYELSPRLQPDGELSKDKEVLLINECIEKGHLQFEWVHKKFTGEIFWVDVLLTKVVLNNEVHIHVTWRDITDKKYLEDELKKRNDELEETNDELYATIENLKNTQEKLIESGKMASLGGLVAGVAHEINRPIDVCVTGITYLAHTTEEIKENYINNESKKEDLLSYFNNTEDLTELINTNLGKTAKLIKKFKQVSIQHDEDKKRAFELKNYLKGIILSLKKLLEEKNIDIKIDSDKEINIKSFPEDFTLVFTNLITNSIEHGFENIEKGLIYIKLRIINDELNITYSNNGKHVDENNIDKIFEPFFTTTKDNENPGLGLNIVYNIVTYKLNGNISFKNTKDGIEFLLNIPIDIIHSVNYNI